MGEVKLRGMGQSAISKRAVRVGLIDKVTRGLKKSRQ